MLRRGARLSSPQSNSQSGFNPKVALQLQANDETMVYASASKGFRAGGAQANFPGCAAESNQPGTRVSGVSDFTAFVGAVDTHSLNANTDAFVTADYSYTGNSISLIVGGSGAVATRPGYGLVNLRFGLDRGQNEISLNFHNLFNVKPNLARV